jgi:hypothetical protein
VSIWDILQQRGEIVLISSIGMTNTELKTRPSCAKPILSSFFYVYLLFVNWFWSARKLERSNITIRMSLKSANLFQLEQFQRPNKRTKRGGSIERDLEKIPPVLHPKLLNASQSTH